MTDLGTTPKRKCSFLLVYAHVPLVLLEQVTVQAVKGGAVVAVGPPGDAVPAEGLDVVLSTGTLDHLHLRVPGEAVNDD